MKLVSGMLLAALVCVAGCGDDSGSTGAGGAGGAGGTGGAGGASSTESATGTGGAGGTAATSTSSGMAQVGDLEVSVQYAGTQVGTLNVAVVTSFPPSGPPVAFKQVENPVFPVTVTLNDLEVGQDLYVAAVLDIGSNNPTNPGPEDLVSVTMPPVQASADSVVAVDLTLTDPQN